MSIRLLKYTHDDDGMLLNYTFLSRFKYVAIFFPSCHHTMHQRKINWDIIMVEKV